MEKKNKFTTTWWSEKWLEMLHNLADSGRLQRGRSYAKSGSILELKIIQNYVSAKVLGSRPKPYQVRFEIKPFDKEEDQKILEILAENPLLITQLLQNQLPTVLFEMLEAEEIYLFPRRWRDLKASCSCPDPTAPCKHMAAVLYQISQKIEENPFLVFNLRNTDLLEELNKTTSKIATTQFNIWYKTATAIEEDVSLPKQDFSLFAAQELDFSTLPTLNTQIPELLSERPPFDTETNFKEVLISQYKVITKEIQKTQFDTLSNINSEQDLRQEVRLAQQWQQLKVEVDGFLNLKTLHLSIENDRKEGNTKNATKLSNSEPIKELPFIDFFNEIPIEYIPTLSPALQWFYYFHIFILQILEKGLFLPRMLRHHKGYFIQWQPANFVVEVEKMMQILAAHAPDDLLFFQAKDRKDSLKKRYYFTNAQEKIAYLSGIYIERYLHAHLGRLAKFKSKWNAFFLLKDLQPFERYSEQNLPILIHLWLEKLFLSKKDLQPLLYIGEIPDMPEIFEVALQVVVRNEPQQAVQEAENLLHTPEKIIDFSTFLSEKKYENQHNLFWQDAYLLSEYLPALKVYLEAQEKTPVPITLEEVSAFFEQALPLLQLLGIKILLPKSLQKILRPKGKIFVKKKNQKNEKGGLLQVQKILDFEWEIALGDKRLDVESFEKLVENTAGLVWLQNQYVWIDQKEVAKILEQAHQTRKNKTQLSLQHLLLGEKAGVEIALEQAVVRLLQPLKEEKSVDLPQNLQATLRPYQQKGYAWLYRNARLGLGSILADDMGLGKTLQTIAFLLKLKEEEVLKEKPALIVLPTTLLANWQQEIIKFAPTLQVFTFYGSQRKFPHTTEQYDIFLTSYGIARTEGELLAGKKWSVLVIDEAQAIKNSDTAQSKALKAIPADLKIALSGTPVENRLSEYWSLFDFVFKGYLGTFNQFYYDYARPIELERNHEILEKFKKVTSPFVMRRVKTDKNIISDLPEKISQNHYCTLTPQQAALYQNVVSQTMEQLAQAEGMQRKGLILKLLGSLKQICNHPAQFLKNDVREAALSGKTQLLIDLLKEIEKQGDKTLIFSQFTQMGEILETIIEAEMGYRPLFLHGGLNLEQRKAVLKQFSETKQIPVLILSLKAGGTGLNLTEANQVIHYDLWWNPAVEAQATDRSFRIGQKKNVFVHRFIVQNSLEEQIDKMIEKKKELAQLTVETGDTWLTELSNEQILELIQLR
ncbi:SNF2-related protein [Hugenholtzia roseola]|uniref:SNF2-related protein n=1 Tax=Hugenholtzia roseola TaxID=1002 RepID=UPI000416E8FC|nr:SNF2-related protein [Hugenholtzia roseola]